MKSSLLSCFILLVMTALAGCSTDVGSRFASRDTTVEYYRVFDNNTDAAPLAGALAASAGIGRNV